jgi:hypothetical protein
MAFPCTCHGAWLTKSIKLDDVENPVSKQAAKRLMDSYDRDVVNALN